MYEIGRAKKKCLSCSCEYPIAVLYVASLLVIYQAILELFIIEFV